MSTRRQQARFIAKVAEAARKPRARPRGRLMPQNMTEEGRRLGLEAARAAPRCQAKRSDGEPCQRAAMRGATRCPTHGGRTEVPDHPAVIARFLNGGFHRAYLRKVEWLEGRAVFEAMQPRERRELIEALPSEVAADVGRVYRAALVWREAGKLPRQEWLRRWKDVTRLLPVTDSQ